MNVIGVQMDIAWEDRAANHRRVQRLLEGRAIEKGSLLVLPEMFASGFSMNTAATADADGSSREFLGKLAREHGVYIVAGVVSPQTRDRACSYNESILIAPDGKELARYQKIHPFTPGGESDNYGKGQRIVTASVGGFTTALFVCYDLRFPEIFRQATRAGAELLVVIANWPVARIGHWVTLLTARAIENQAYVVGVNRVGRDPALEYTGRSLIIGPGGEIIADAGTSEGLVHATIDPETVRQVRSKLPFLRDIRPEFLPPLGS